MQSIMKAIANKLVSLENERISGMKFAAYLMLQLY